MIAQLKPLKIDLTAKRFNPFEPAEQIAMVLLAQQGNKTAENRIVETSLRFVAGVARQFHGGDLEFSDLFAEGVIGLREAVFRFEAGKDVRFISYAVWWIRAYINRAIIDTGFAIRTPSPYAQKSNPDLVEASAQMRNTVGLEAMMAKGWNLADPGTSTDASILEESQRRFIERWSREISHKEKDVIWRRFGLNPSSCGDRETLAAIGKSLNLSKERIRQLQDKGIRKMRNHPMCQKIKMSER